ncbi:MAG TPA: phenylalanine--tRNA ligase beta subunit-related protein [Vicinamibacteria bacterium]|jgi:DNA/RNA-binding domain of Phe-tRNA-synthetase-like protein
MITLSGELAGRLLLANAQFDDIDLSQDRSALQAELASVCETLRKRYQGTPWLEIPGVTETRSLYKAIGLDPTKVRPSSEALLRRVLKGQPLYQVNLLVDTVNLCSLEFQLSYGVYDLETFVPPIEARLGRPGESYAGIRKGPVHLDGRICLADETGPFGNPTSDSARASISENTRRALVVIFAPHTMKKELLARRLEHTVERVSRFTGARHIVESPP